MKATWLALAAVAAVSVGTVLAQYPDISDFKTAKPEDKVDHNSERPPKDATILFDGKSLENWTKPDRKSAAHWKLVDKVMQVEKGGNLISREEFGGSLKLHVEFRVPYLPEAKGQNRGNSGIYLQGRYEVQVLDSYGLESKNDDCGAIYGVAAPKVNASKAPTVWQAYDIEFHAPQYEDGKKTANARMTVFHNGVKIHDNVEIDVDNTRGGLGGDPAAPGPILLQDHGCAVQYRNIWLVPIR